MPDDFRGIEAFIEVACQRSFTRAAARLGVSQSALSHTIRALEERLGLRLLARTTRSVAPTEAGERLIRRVAPRFAAIGEELAAFGQSRGEPAGTVRIAASDFAASTVLWPRLSRIKPAYPALKIEVAIQPEPADIAAGRFDAGVRCGDQVAADMTAVRISPDFRMMIVGAPSYLAGRAPPERPADLVEHECITMRLAAHGGVQPWELRKGKRTVQVRVDGSWTFNSLAPAVDAALAGFGLAYVPEELAQPHVGNGLLVPVLQDWWPTLPGLYIFHARGRESSPALSLVVEALRHRT